MIEFTKRIVRGLWFAYLFVYQPGKFHDLAGLLRGPDVSGAIAVKRLFVTRARGLLFPKLGTLSDYVVRRQPALSCNDIERAVGDLGDMEQCEAGNHFMMHVRSGLSVLAELPLLTGEEREEIERLHDLVKLLSLHRARWGAWFADYPWKK